tara:strand:+ start:1784 stop:4942 length:3159 start_codon:yes stop_codon:yes gene_type:complete
MSKDTITLNGSFKEITMTEFLLNDARGEFIKTRTNRLGKMYEMFVTKKIKEDKETYKSYIQIFNTLRSNNSKLIIDNTLTSKSTKELQWDKFIEYYNIQYVVSLIKVYYEKDNRRDELIKKLNVNAFNEAIRLNHPIVEIVKFISNKTNINILATLSKEKKISEKERGNIFLDIVEEKFNESISNSQKIDSTDKSILQSKYNQLITQGGGGPYEYNAIKNILEKIAEVKHDFTDAKRAPYLKKALGTKYNGKLEEEVDKVWESEKENNIQTVNTILKNPIDKLTKEAANQFPKFLSGIKVLMNKCLINFNNTLRSSDHEPKLFNQLFLQKILQNPPRGTQPTLGDLIYNRYKFFSYNTQVNEGFNIFSLTGEGISESKKLVINFAEGSDFLKTIKTILDSGEFIYDTSSGMPNTSKLLEDMSLKKLTPICNIWDPASASISALNKNIEENESLKTNLIDVEPINNARRNINIGEHHSDHQLFEVSINMNGEGKVNEDNPIKLSIYPEGESRSSTTSCPATLKDIYLKGGLSVNMLDTIYKLVTENIPVTPELHKKTFEKSIEKEQLIKLVEYLQNYLNKGLDGRENEAYRQKVLSLLIFDLKKTGDWSQINWLNKYKSHFLVSGDKLCALYNIINDNKTLFGTTAQLKNNQISADLGIYINADKEPSEEEVNKLYSDLVQKLSSVKTKYDINVKPIPRGARETDEEANSFYHTKDDIEHIKDSEEELITKKEYFSTIIEILSNFNKLLKFDIKSYKEDISSINSILIESIILKFTADISEADKTKLRSLKAATSIETAGEGRRSRRVQSRLQNDLENINNILEDIRIGTSDQDCNPLIRDKINTTPSENITRLFDAINSVDNINYIYLSIPTIYSKTLHLISSLKVTPRKQVKYELMNIFTKLFFNLDFNNSHDNERWELGDQTKLDQLHESDGVYHTRGSLEKDAEEALGIHLDNLAKDLDSILYLINCILDSNYDTESETVVNMANQINEMQKRLNKKIELKREDTLLPEDVEALAERPGIATYSTNLVTEDQPRQPIASLNVPPRQEGD